jgi:hypothetical protein
MRINSAPRVRAPSGFGFRRENRPEIRAVPRRVAFRAGACPRDAGTAVLSAE